MEPTRGAIGQIFGGGAVAGSQPLLEVRNVKRLEEMRYSITVTDGEWVVKALSIRTDSNLIEEVEQGRVVVNSLLRLLEYRLEELNGNVFLIISKAENLGQTPPQLRVPNEALKKWPTRNGAEATQADPAAAAAAQAQAVQAQLPQAQLPQAPLAQAGQVPPWAAQAAFTTPERRASAGFADQTPPQPMGARAAVAQGHNPYGGVNPMNGMPPQGGNGAALGGPAASAYGAAAAASGAANGGRAGNLSDYFGRQPLASKPPGGGAQGGFLPIAELSPYTNGRWKIKARIVTKGDIRRFTNARGEGQLFKIDLADQSGEISATFFGKAVDAFYPNLRQGQVYSFTRGHIKQGNPRWDRTEHVLTFEESASIEALEDTGEMPGVTYDFKPLCMVPEMDVNSQIDVQAIIYQVNDPYTFTSKNSNREMSKREIGLWDNSGPEGSSCSTLTLWGERALNDSFELHAPIFLKGARVTEWNNQKDLASPAVYEMNPDDPRAFALKAKYEEYQRTRMVPLTMTRNTQSAPGSRKTIRGCREEDLNLGPPPSMMGQGLDPNGPRSVHRHYVMATVTHLPNDRLPCYPACPGLVDRPSNMAATQGGAAEKRQCNKKVTNEGGTVWRCAAGHMCQQPVYRYLAKLQVMDHTDAIEVNVYDEVMNRLFGVNAGQYAQMYESAEQEANLQQVNRRVLWRRVVLKLRSQKEIWQESERVRYNVDEASGVTLVREGKSMLADIKAALAAEQQP